MATPREIFNSYFETLKPIVIDGNYTVNQINSASKQAVANLLSINIAALPDWMYKAIKAKFVLGIPHFKRQAKFQQLKDMIDIAAFRTAFPDAEFEKRLSGDYPSLVIYFTGKEPPYVGGEE